jgi:hypothetical protein
MEEQNEMKPQYETPKLTDHGDLRELTQALDNFGDEDGGVKHVAGFGGFGDFSH